MRVLLRLGFRGVFSSLRLRFLDGVLGSTFASSSESSSSPDSLDSSLVSTEFSTLELALADRHFYRHPLRVFFVFVSDGPPDALSSTIHKLLSRTRIDWWF